MEPSAFQSRVEARSSVLTDRRPAPRDRYGLHLLLFVLTLLSTTIMGAQFAGRVPLYEAAPALFRLPLLDLPVSVPFLLDGLRFSLALLGFLTVHEFGHYFAARHHRISTSLPYYIPLPPPLGFGTLGAVIRIREPIPTTRRLFDVGAAGPLAGFVVALGLLLWALATLPPPTYALDFFQHDALKAFVQEFGRLPERPLPGDAIPGGTLVFGETLLYRGLASLFPNVPPMFEMYHYPVLFAGWLGLFFTALNLLPVGQLDGGHILYALVGPRWHGRVARGVVVLLLLSSAIGYADEIVPWFGARYGVAGVVGAWVLLAGILYFFLTRIFDGDLRWIGPVLGALVGAAAVAVAVGGVAEHIGYTGWFLWCLLIVLLIKVDHPPVVHPEPLTPARRALGVLSLVLFVLCFSFRPIYFL